MSLWDSIYSSDDSYFGNESSVLARESLNFFKKYQCKSILEFGCGQGRDTLLFASNGMKVHSIDSSVTAVEQLIQNIKKLGLEGRVKVSRLDLAKDLPSLEANEVMDTVYSNLFYRMPFNDQELQRLFDFVRNVLPVGGLHIFSIRNKNTDRSFGKGKKIAKDTFVINGFKVRFFTQEEILRFNRGFKTLRTMEAYEEPCSLILAFTVKIRDFQNDKLSTTIN